MGCHKETPGSGSPYHFPELEVAHRPLASGPPRADLEAPASHPKEQEGAAMLPGGLRSEQVLASSQPLLFMAG